MRVKRGHAFWGLVASLTALALVPACGADAGTAAKTSSSPSMTPAPTAATTTAAAPPQAPPTQAPLMQKWVDLQAGDCLADPPPTDPSVVTVTVVDCASAHQAEVYLRAAVPVNAAVADVGNQQCQTGLSQYTGRSAGASPFTITYLIDSEQDRTSNNPYPSTVICLLQGASGQSLTGSAHG